MYTTRYYLLDIVRGLAAFSIVIFHYKIFYSYNISETTLGLTIDNQPFYNYLYYFYEFGWIAVQFFFIISGFIFYDLYLNKIKEKKISSLQFFKLRFSRLYPLHFVTLILATIILYFSNKTSYIHPIIGDLKHFFLNIFLIHKWGFESSNTFNNPSWSISIEVLLYFIFFTVFNYGKNEYLITFLLLFASIPIFFLNKFIGYGLFCFYIGGLTYLIFQKILANKNLYKFIYILSCLLIFISTLIFNYLTSDQIIKIVAFTILFPSIIINLMLLQVSFNEIGKSFKIIGDISYSVYLIHWIIQAFFIRILFNYEIKINFDSNYFFIIYIITVFLISVISFKFFERPVQNYLRSIFL